MASRSYVMFEAQEALAAAPSKMAQPCCTLESPGDGTIQTNEPIMNPSLGETVLI